MPALSHTLAGAITTILIAAALGPSARAERPAEQGSGASPTFDLSRLAAECALVEDEVGKAAPDGFRRERSLVMIGRSSAAEGEFRVSAAAYLMFLNEFGLRHEWADRVVPRLIDSLAPLRTETVDIILTERGPRYEPTWRAGHSAEAADLDQAAAVCEVIAAQSPDARKAGVLVKLGWIQRARGDWAAATGAWDRAAAVAPSTPTAIEALWLSAENCELLGQPVEAIERLEQLARHGGDDPRGATARQRIDRVQREMRRDETWLADPVSGFQREVGQAGAEVAASRYTETARWLGRNRRTSVLATLAEWASRQADWPVAVRVAAFGDLAEASLAAGTDEGRAGAVDALGGILAISEESSWIVSTTLRRSALLRDLGRAGEALSAIESAEERVRGPREWGIRLTPEKVRVLVALGDVAAARSLLSGLEERYADHTELAALRVLVGLDGAGEDR
jgi:tetratricopeptide (TPR) repeat protein